jgi:hypothetical protein
MLKNILKLDGAQQLSKKEQKEINGGGRMEPDGCSIFISWPHTPAECVELDGVYNSTTGRCAYTYSVC